MEITQAQNSDHNLELLAAQRKIYSEAKRLREIRMIGALVLAALAPVLAVVLPQASTVMAVVGGVWLAISSLVLQRIESESVKRAATVQEQFDTGLFDLPWNRILVGQKVSPELISAANRSLTYDRAKLRDWYADTSDIAYPLGVILCQRSSLVWDWRLQRYYGWGVAVVTGSFFVIGIVIGYVTDRTIPEYILGLLVPSLPAFLFGNDLVKEHLRAADEKQRLESKVADLWNTGMNNPASVTKEDSRRIQDCIYFLRSKGPLVPDWWYARLRDAYQADMQTSVRTMRAEAQKRSPNGPAADPKS